ncbi:MAG: hypothetical protein AB7G15_09500 [Alphaproteobacteria bacterium]
MIGLLALLVIVFAAGGSASARADGCYICTSGSSSYCKNQCAYRGKDTQENRKRCRDAGCKIGGTTSCSTAANIKVCLSDRAPAQPRRYATSFELFESRSVD